MEDQLILDYLVVRGCSDVATTFAREAGLPMPNKTEVEARGAITAAIRRGSIDEAVSLLDAFDPQFLNAHPTVSFELRRHQLAQLVAQIPPNATGASEQAAVAPLVAFAQTHLVPLVNGPNIDEELRKDFTHKLEAVMALLLYPDAGFPESTKLLEPEERTRLADDVNLVMLKEQGHPGVARLTSALRAYNWAHQLEAEPPASASLPGSGPISSSISQSQVTFGRRDTGPVDIPASPVIPPLPFHRVLRRW